MSGRPKLLDLFCCEGGAAVGYDRAGFDVYGIDIDPKVAKRYPYPIHIGDALDVLRRLIAGESIGFGGDALTLADFHAIHASPPCQAYSKTTNAYDSDGKHPELVEPTRELLIESGLPYVIENVEGAPLLDPLTLCGTEFGLRAPDEDGVMLQLRRHRLFESNTFLMGPGGCDHDPTLVVAGVYSGSRHNRPAERDNPARRGGYAPRGLVAAALLDIDWMTQYGRNQSIPPAYSEFIGAQLLASLSGEVTA